MARDLDVCTSAAGFKRRSFHLRSCALPSRRVSLVNASTNAEVTHVYGACPER
jgi:hypothetical protein